MGAELDHVFILRAVGAPEAEALVALGLCEGPANTHPGQGTACRRFFFDNAYLELLWVSDADEAQREPARATRIFERWSRRGSGASPFGIVLRPGSPAHDPPPFPAWSYHPPYLPSGMTIEVAVGTPLEEPELFYLPFAHRDRGRGREPYPRGSSPATIRGVEIGLPGAGERSGRDALRGGNRRGVLHRRRRARHDPDARGSPAGRRGGPPAPPSAGTGVSRRARQW